MIKKGKKESKIEYSNDIKYTEINLHLSRLLSSDGHGQETSGY